MREKQYTLQEWREIQNARNRKYYKAHPELRLKHNARVRTYFKNNPKKYKEHLKRMREWRKKHRDYYKLYRKTHKKELAENVKRYSLKNRELILARNRAYYHAHKTLKKRGKK